MATKNHKFIEYLAPGQKKFELTEETKEVDGHILHRIRAVIHIKSLYYTIDLKKGTLGGWVEKESNLSHVGACWIFHEGMVYGDARVSSAGSVGGKAKVYGEAQISDNAMIMDQSEIYGGATIRGSSIILDEVKVYDYASVVGATISGHAEIYGNARVTGDVDVGHNARIYENAVIGGRVHISDRAKIYGSAHIECYDSPSGCVIWISGDTEIAGNAKIAAQ
ncbi:hypothetical protein IKX73_01975 [Candidatus Saccharibacteria bacterium]|nr:hypothetical protein [Candidatus Saccharibacteria bacterium]